MITIVKVVNPFNVDTSRVIEQVDYNGENKLQDYIKEFEKQVPKTEIMVQLNGEILKEKDYNQVLADDSYVVLSVVVSKGGSGSKIFSVVAMVALSALAFGLGGLPGAGGAWGAVGSTAGWGFSNYLVATAVMFLGGQLISGSFAKTQDVNSNGSDPTYSWGGAETTEGQGNAIAITYGTVQSGGQSIGKFVTNENEKQYLNWLVCAGEGELAFSKIQLNDNDIGNYTGVALDIREGYNDQAVIPNFNDTYSVKALGYELFDYWRTEIIQGNTTQGIVIDIDFNSGLYHYNDEGEIREASVGIEAQYCINGSNNWQTFVGGQVIYNNVVGAVIVSPVADGSYWIRVTSSGGQRTILIGQGSMFKNSNIRWSTNVGYVTSGRVQVGAFTVDIGACINNNSTTITVASNATITGASTSALRRSFRIDNLPMNTYAVRVRVVSRSADINSTKDMVRCWWSGLSSVVYDDFTYPNMALIGIRALATDQISGSPTLKFIKTRATVWVWNSNTQQYEAKDATNPAWASYDFCHSARRIKNIHTGQYEFVVRGVPASLMLFDKFNAWATRCTEMNLHINYEVATTGEFWDIVNTNIAPIGRGKVVQFGTKFGCIFDAPSQPVQLFTMGNIITGSFTEEFLSTDDRANVVEISFPNKDKDYEKDTMVIYGKDYDTIGSIENRVSITLDGCTSYEQAYREAKYQLFCNTMLVRTCTFEADIDAIGCTVGDQILLSHDIPEWANSGRILSVDTDNSSITVPMNLDFNSDTEYRVQLRTQKDTIFTYKVLSVVNDEDIATITFATPFLMEDLPKKNDIFSYGEVNKTAKPFIVKSITRTQEMRRKITCLEYNENVFNEQYDIPVINYSSAPLLSAQNVENLSARQVQYSTANGRINSVMYVSFSMPYNAQWQSFDILLSTDGTNYNLVRATNQMNFSLDTVPATTYYLKVITKNGLTQSAGVILYPVEAGIDELPPDVTDFDCEVLSGGTRRYTWNFEYPTPNDIAGFRIKYMQGNEVDWQRATEITEGLVTSQPYEALTVRNGTHTIMIKAVDYAGQESKNFAFVRINLADLLEENVLYKRSIRENNWEGVTTDGRINEQGNITAKQSSAFWVAKTNPHWHNPTSPYWEQIYKSFELVAQITPIVSGQFWLQTDIEGALDIDYKVVYNQANYEYEVEESPYRTYTGKVMVKAGDTIYVKVSSIAGLRVASIVRDITVVIDVPDRQEHFEDFVVKAEGTELPIVTPNYHTSAIHVDSCQTEAVATIVAVTYEPCVLKCFDKDGIAIDAVLDITWQGYEQEVII